MRGARLEWAHCCSTTKELFTLLDLCVSSLRRGHANLLCIVPILTDDPRRESKSEWPPLTPMQQMLQHIPLRNQVRTREQPTNTPGQDRTGDLQRVRLTS